MPENGLMYAAVRDITEERAVVEELAEANTRLREQIAERERVEATLQQLQRLEVVGQLTAGVAHDFNNLLTVILTSATFASREYQRGKTEKLETRLQHIKDAGERGAKLTAQLLSFSRRQRLQPRPVDLNATILGMQNPLSKALGASVWVEMSLADNLWMAAADPTQTEMIILNLAINARDAMTLGTGKLQLRTQNEIVVAAPTRPEDPEPGNYVVFSISDSGSGMDAETLQKAFEPFFTTKPVGQGSGLGLAQVFGFAKQSGGGVKIETTLNVGTSVSVYLPMVEHDDHRVIDALPPANESGEHTPRRILLVDDDDAVRSVTAIMLESFGHQVIQASSGVSAMAQLNSEIELVVTDYAMPGMTGGELAAMVADVFPTLPVMFITGYADTDVLGLQRAVVVQKPFVESDLRQKLMQALASKSEKAVS